MEPHPAAGVKATFTLDENTARRLVEASMSARPRADVNSELRAVSEARETAGRRSQTPS